MRMLHVVPDSVVNPAHHYLGSTKDIRSRTEYLRRSDIQYEEVVVTRTDSALRAALKSMPLDAIDAVLIEFALYPRSMKWLRHQAPHILQIVRPTNASALQQLHLARLALTLPSPPLAGFRRSGGALLRSVRRFQKEVACARRADYVLSITEWERTNYWQRLTSRPVVTVPYFVPAEYGESRIGGWQKRDDCVCLTSSSVSPFLLDAARNFERLVGRLCGRCSAWRFFITGEVASGSGTPSNRIIRPGFVSNLSELLGGARAIALLSDYGFGFKTKVLDAVRFECFMLVTARIYQRMPVEARPFCLVIDPSSIDSFVDALEKCREGYPSGNLNDTFRQQAFRALDSVIRGR